MKRKMFPYRVMYSLPVYDGGGDLPLLPFQNKVPLLFDPMNFSYINPVTNEPSSTNYDVQPDQEFQFNSGATKRLRQTPEEIQAYRELIQNNIERNAPIIKKAQKFHNKSKFSISPDEIDGRNGGIIGVNDACLGSGCKKSAGKRALRGAAGKMAREFGGELDNNKTTNDLKQWLVNWYNDPKTKSRMGADSSMVPAITDRINKVPVNYVRRPLTAYDGRYENGSIDVYKNSPEVVLHELNHAGEWVPSINGNYREDLKHVPNNKYLTDPSEQHSRFMEIRKALNKNPGDVITEDELKSMKKFKALEDLKKIYKDWNSLTTQLNTIASSSNSLNRLVDGGGITPMKSINTARVNIPTQTKPYAYQKPGIPQAESDYDVSQGLGYASAGAAALGTVAETLANNNQQRNPYRNYLPGNSTSQKTVDSLVNMIPVVGQFYSAAKSIGNYAKTDYTAQNEYGELANTNKFIIADTISTFIDPLGSFISGLSGEGWTPNERANKINSKGALNKKLDLQRKAVEFKDSEINAGYGGRYWDQNQMMVAEMGGPLKKRFMQPLDNKLPKGRINPFYYQESSELSTSIGGENGEPAYLIPTFKYGKKLENPIEEFNKTGEHLGGPFKTWQDAEEFGKIRHKYVELNQNIPSPISTSNYKYGGNLPYVIGESYEDGGVLPAKSMVTEYKEGGTHQQNPNGGIPVDNKGNLASASKTRPVALTEEGEVSYFSKSKGTAYVFSNKIVMR